MLVFTNFRPRAGAYGGANAFLRTLVAELERRGLRFTSEPAAPFDVALLNALTDGLDLAQVQRLAERGRPLVHRKTGYRGRGSEELRALDDGVPVGDRLQVAFDPYLAHTVFQSRYSREVFAAAGSTAPASVIHNGVDDRVFTVVERRRLRGEHVRPFWQPGEQLRLVVSSWSADPHKGFPEYERVAGVLAGRRDAALTLVGRVPPGLRLPGARLVKPQPPERLARLLRRSHVILQLAQWETCSNALLEGLSCGLPAVYLDSGANAELAAPYGVAYEGDVLASLDAIRERYADAVARLSEGPFRIGPVADRYAEVLDAVVAGRPPAETTA